MINAGANICFIVFALLCCYERSLVGQFDSGIAARQWRTLEDSKDMNRLINDSRRFSALSFTQVCFSLPLSLPLAQARSVERS